MAIVKIASRRMERLYAAPHHAAADCLLQCPSAAGDFEH
jgi:hypothetical protein